MASDYAKYNKSHCLIIIRKGRLVGEWYWGKKYGPDVKIKSWSIGKSYASTAAGLALEHGKIKSLKDSIADYIPSFKGTKKEDITIHHVLNMTSGTKFDEIADNLGMFNARDMTTKALNNPVRKKPGSAWEYNNHTVQLIEPIIRNATGVPADEYINSHLWMPAGIRIKLDNLQCI